jgi:tetratricopeptide (TPR) repeat protein
MRGVRTVLVLALAAVVAGCRGHESAKSASAKASLATITLREVREEVEEAYRLKPDRRFLRAFGSVDELFSGHPGTSAAATYADGKWKVTYGGKDVGTLSDPPGFDETLTLLGAYAQQLAKGTPAQKGPALPAADRSIKAFSVRIERFDAEDLFAALRDLDAKWNSTHDPALLVPASRAYAYLDLQRIDYMGVADDFSAKALAVTAAARALAGADGTEEEALLANETDYGAAAMARARKLPVTSPIREAIQEGKARLDMLAAASKAGRYLALREVSYDGDESAWSSWLARHDLGPGMTLPIARTALTLQRFETNADWSLTLASASLDEANHVLDGGSGPPAPTAGWRGEMTRVGDFAKALATLVRMRSTNVCDLFEHDVAAASSKLHGSLLDAGSFEAYYRGAFYTGVFGFGLHQLDWLSSEDAARSFDAVVGKAEAPLPAQLGAWYHHLVAWKGGDSSLSPLVTDLESQKALGTWPISRTFDELREHTPYSDPSIVHTARAFFRRLDSRCPDRETAGQIALKSLLDLPLYRRLTRSAVTDGEYSVHPLAVAQLTGDMNTIRAFLVSPAADAASRLTAVEELTAKKALDENAYRTAMTSVLKDPAYAGRWTTHKDFAKHLEAQGSRREAEEVVTSWLARNPGADPFAIYNAHTVLSRLHLADGDAKLAWNDVQPGLHAFHQSAVAQASLTLDAMGHREEARKLGEQNVERYPDVDEAHLSFAELLWRQGDGNAAAETLTNMHPPLNSWQWRTAGERFLAVFGNAPIDRALAAWTPLSEAGGPFDLQQFIYPIASAGKTELAFRMQSGLHADGLGELEMLMASYDYLERWKGTTEATAWLRDAVPSQIVDPASMFIYPEHNLELLWTLTSSPSRGEPREFVYLMRAAAALKSPAIRKAHQQDLADHYNASGSGDYYPIGRVVMGLADESSLAPFITSPKRRCEIAYYLGAKAQADGRKDDAVAWFRVVLETRQSENGEYRWAKDALLRNVNAN